MPCVTVVIPAHRSPEYLNQAVESVAAQSFADYEILVVDDGSGDEVVSQYRLPERARLLRLPASQGHGAVPRNAGLRAARGEYIAQLDQDDLWQPEKLERQVATLAAHPEVGLTYCHFTMVDEALRPLAKQGKFWAPGADPLRQALMGEPLMNPSTTLVRKQVFEVCGPFDEEVFFNDDRGILAAEHGQVRDPRRPHAHGAAAGARRTGVAASPADAQGAGRGDA